jgi:hypothetical protein
MNSTIRNYLQQVVEEGKRLETLLAANESADLEKVTTNLMALTEVIKVERQRESGCFSPAEMRARAEGLAEGEDNKMKKAWKAALNNRVVENVTDILVECRDGFMDLPDRKKVMKAIGPLKSRTWQLFVLNVVSVLKKKGSFQSNTFQDTAGGADEIVWNVACDLIEASE